MTESETMLSGLETRALLADLTISQWSAIRRDQTGTLAAIHATGAAADAGSYAKQLLPAVTAPIAKAAGAIRTEHYRLTLPWCQRGPRLLPLAMHQRYTAAMRQLIAAFGAEVDRGAGIYLAERARREASLGRMWDPRQYPDTAEEWRGYYAAEYSLHPVPADEYRCALGAADLAELLAALKRDKAAAAAAARADLVDRLREKVAALGQLDGRQRGFQRVLDSASELAEMVPAMNLDSDEGIEKVAAELGHMAKLYDGETIREDEGARAYILNRARKLRETLEFLA